MDKRELAMYSVQDIIEDLLLGVPIKRTARLRKVSKNTVKKYRDMLHAILTEHPEFENSIELIMGKIIELRKEERYSLNFGWLDKNSSLVDALSSECENYIRLLEVLHEHCRNFPGTASRFRSGRD